MRKAIFLLAATAAAAPAGAANIVIDDFSLVAGAGFPAVQAYRYPNAEQLTASGTSTTGTIVGGTRDLTVTLTKTLTNVQDNNQATAVIRPTALNGDGAATMSIGIGGAADFSFVYDGAGVGDGAAGLGLDLASLGNQIRISILYSAVLGASGSPLVPLVLTLTDEAGRMASVSQSIDADGAYYQTATYGFGAFEAANGQFDLRNVHRIALTSSHEQVPSGFSSAIQLGGIATFGGAYSPTNVIAPAVPEPGTWAMMALGFGLVGASARRRRTLASA